MHRDPLIVSLKENEEREMPPEPYVAPVAPPRRRKRRDWTGMIVLAICIGAGIGVYSYMTNESSAPSPSTETPAMTTEKQTLSIIERVEKHIVLPEGEEPTIATVSDPSKLAEQRFFANAKVGDVVLIYAQARKAYLYDPSIDKLLEVAPIAQ